MDEVRMSLLRWGGRRVIVELQGLCIERSRHTLHSPGFPSVLALANFRVTVHPTGLWCRRIYFFLASATRKEGARSDQSVGDHVDVAVELALGRQRAPEVVPERVIWGR